MHLSFHGAARNVTGSCYLLELPGLNVLVDCGMTQERRHIKRNWEPFNFSPADVDVMLLTHAHLDHCGLIPKLVRDGFTGRILCTEPSVELAQIVMLDSARIQEEDAAYKLKRFKRDKRKPKHPIIPLYTVDDATAALPHFDSVRYGETTDLGQGVSVVFEDAGHVLGSASLTLTYTEDDDTKRVVFSGDVGQWDRPLIGDPTPATAGDVVVMESTYGNREHRDEGDIAEQLAKVVNTAHECRGNVVIPTFAIERAQELLFHLSGLVRSKRIPRVPVFLDSPMAINVTHLFRRYRSYMDEETTAMLADGHDPLDFPGLYLAKTRDESKSINAVRGTAIILAGSGMCTGGRVKHHLKQNLGRPESTVLFVGYQAPGTLGNQISGGDPEVRIFGRMIPVECTIARLHGMSAHGDKHDLLRWLNEVHPAPEHVYLTHGEESVAVDFAKTVAEELGCDASAPHYRQRSDH